VSLAIAGATIGSARAQAAPRAMGAGMTGGTGAPAGVLEGSLGLGYGAPIGTLQSSAALRDVAASGAEAELGLGWRARPELFAGVYASGSKLVVSHGYPNTAGIYTAGAGVRIDVHLRPEHGIDPWLGIGAGWHGLWVTPPNGLGTTSRHGVDVVHAEIGADVHATPRVTMSPVLGVSVTAFLVENAAGMDTWRAMSGPLDAFVFVGLVGRFDAPPSRHVSAR
jgi:hypothetical protein